MDVGHGLGSLGPLIVYTTPLIGATARLVEGRAERPHPDRMWRLVAITASRILVLRPRRFVHSWRKEASPGSDLISRSFASWLEWRAWDAGGVGHGSSSVWSAMARAAAEFSGGTR